VAEKNVSKIKSGQSAWRSVGCKRLSVSHGAGAIVERQIVKKAKAASEGKGRIRGFGGPKMGSVDSEPRPGRGRMAIENGREEVEGAYGAERAKAVVRRCVAHPGPCLDLNF